MTANTDLNSAPRDAGDFPEASDSTTSTEKEATPNNTRLPSHSTLVFSNYPPLWSRDSKRDSQPKAQRTFSDSVKESGASASALNAVMRTTSSDDKKLSGKFEDKDSYSRYEHLKGRDHSWAHPRINIFGRDIAPMGKPAAWSGYGSGKKKK